MSEDSYTEPSLETGEGCFDFHYDFSKYIKDENEAKKDIVGIIGAYFRMMPPTYAVDKLGSFSQATVDESEILHKDYYPVITSIKHLPRRGPQIHAPNDILEIRRAIIFKGFWNMFPHPEEVIIIDRSKLRKKPHDVVL